MPAPHGAQLVNPEESAFFPASQGTHAPCSVLEVYFPGVQDVHVAAAAALYLPAMQVSQELKPEKEAAFPAVQSSQFIRESGKVEVEYFPVWQSTHMVDASKEEYFPLTQAKQTLAPADDFAPALHAEQAVEPSVGAAVPAYEA